MKKRNFVLLSLVFSLTFMAGCTTHISRLEMDYGASFYMAKCQQTFNPEAGKNLEPVKGFNGQAAINVIERYKKGFEKQAVSSPLTLNINTGK